MHVIRRLLLYKFADRAIVFDQFDPSDIRQFISEQLQLGGSISHATGLVSALARLQEPESNIHRYHAPDSLLEFLKNL